MRFDNLDDWLAWQETLNPAEIDLGLDRVRQVMQQADMSDRFDCPLIIVAGTNGKGSTVAFIEAIARAHGMRVCCYTSPHISRYNERIRIDGDEVTDGELCEAFARVDEARGEVALTYFEFGTLAAIDLFHRAVETSGIDLVVMEIGLGGRLDAVNVMQPDVAVITTIALDHTDWLGDTRDAIAAEKAGVMRSGIPVVIGDLNPPDVLFETARGLGAVTVTLNHDMFVAAGDDNWSLMLGETVYHGLPLPRLAGMHQLGNAACAIAALSLLPGDDGLLQQHIATGLRETRLAARLQRVALDNCADAIVDVAHNTEAVTALVEHCRQNPVEGSTRLVLAIMADKPVAEMVGLLCQVVDDWHVCALAAVDRAMQVPDLKRVIEGACANVKLTEHAGVEQACRQLQQTVGTDDRIIVTGSFYTVAAALHALE